MNQRLEEINSRIRKAAEQCGRDPQSVRLVAVSKTVPSERVLEAINSGVTILGENYIQEARQKFDALNAHPIAWHFIGHLQTNKAKYAVRIFDLIHSVDSIKLAREINKRAARINKIQNILVQVNISQEASKSGVHVDHIKPLIQEISGMSNLKIKGLMTMPPFFNQPEKVRPYFGALRNLRDELLIRENVIDAGLHELSMGMTGDFEVAIQEGATLVRIGTAIFGARK
ncbi:YggS family pyridoxal phosphate-dependent enzyme [Desulfococcaceae bacterium HSG9]|nr:YggS family pyridoxal phosphate-dependent enzyme [Desulfococcaceae bacterium HSG9]